MWDCFILGYDVSVLLGSTLETGSYHLTIKSEVLSLLKQSHIHQQPRRKEFSFRGLEN